MTETKRAPYTIKAQKQLAVACRVALDIVANADSTQGRHIRAALDECEREERAHRRMGARFTRGAARYRLSAHDSASLMMGRSFFCDALERLQPANDRAECLATLRSDHLAMTLARALTSDATLARAVARLCALGPGGDLGVCQLLAEWDYAHDCAVH